MRTLFSAPGRFGRLEIRSGGVRLIQPCFQFFRPPFPGLECPDEQGNPGKKCRRWDKIQQPVDPCNERLRQDAGAIIVHKVLLDLRLRFPFGQHLADEFAQLMTDRGRINIQRGVLADRAVQLMRDGVHFVIGRCCCWAKTATEGIRAVENIKKNRMGKRLIIILLSLPAFLSCDLARPTPRIRR